MNTVKANAQCVQLAGNSPTIKIEKAPVLVCIDGYVPFSVDGLSLKVDASSMRPFELENIDLCETVEYAGVYNCNK